MTLYLIQIFLYSKVYKIILNTYVDCKHEQLKAHTAVVLSLSCAACVNMNMFFHEIWLETICERNSIKSIISI